MTRPITFLSDYGYDDDFVGVCHAVIARIAPESTVIDLTHGINRHAVGGGRRRARQRPALRAGGRPPRDRRPRCRFAAPRRCGPR